MPRRGILFVAAGETGGGWIIIKSIITRGERIGMRSGTLRIAVYSQTGLQSNQPGSIYPKNENTKAIVNDRSNRTNLRKLISEN